MVHGNICDRLTKEIGLSHVIGDEPIGAGSTAKSCKHSELWASSANSAQPRIDSLIGPQIECEKSLKTDAYERESA